VRSQAEPGNEENLILNLDETITKE